MPMETKKGKKMALATTKIPAKVPVDLTTIDYKKLPANLGQQGVIAFSSTKDMQEELQNTRGKSLKLLSLGIWKAGKENSEIAQLVGSIHSDDDKVKEYVREEVRCALGMRKRTKDPKGAIKYEWQEWWFEHFPRPGEDASTDEGKKRRARAQNFVKQLDKAIMSAFGALSTGSVFKQKSESGPLMISGPAVKEHFGVEEVTLDERQKVPQVDKNGAPVFDDAGKPKMVELAKKPSFTEVNRMGANKIGKEVKTRAQTGHTVVLGSSEEDIIGLLNSLTIVLQSPTFTPKVIEAMHKMFPKLQAAVEKHPLEDEGDETEDEGENEAAA